jgi:hypothetical protein
MSGQTNTTVTDLPLSSKLATPVAVASGGIDAAGNSVTLATANNHDFAVSGEGYELLKYFDAESDFNTLTNMVAPASHVLDLRDKFVELVDGVYTIDLPSTIEANKHGLYANIAVADLALGVHNYKIVKTYPDGRVETIEDTAEVTSLDANQVAVFASSTKADNTKFTNNWRIAELSSVMEKGTYTFEFTIGTASRKFTVNLIDRPSLKIKTLSLGTTDATLFGTAYTIKVGSTYSTAGLVLSFDKTNLTDSNFVSVKEVSDPSSLFTVTAGFNSSALQDDLKLSLKDVGSFSLGSLTGTPTSNAVVGLELTFYKKVNYSENSNRYVVVGETQLIYLSFIAPFAPVVSSVSAVDADTTGAGLVVTVTATTNTPGTLYVVLVADAAAVPTAAQIIAGSGGTISRAANKILTTAGQTTVSITAASAAAWDVYTLLVDANGLIQSAISAKADVTVEVS